MKDKIRRNHPSDELIAAYLDGNVTAHECEGVLRAAQHDSRLREILEISLQVDAELGLHMQGHNHLPMTALAAECKNSNCCCLECEKYILREQGIAFDADTLYQQAVDNGWLKPNGTALYNVGRTLEQNGMIVSRSYSSQLCDIEQALKDGDSVMVAVDGGELLGDLAIEHLEDAYIGAIPDHIVVVKTYDANQNIISVYDPNSVKEQDEYSLQQFMDAWADSNNYLVIIKTKENMKNYTPKPIDVNDVVLKEDVSDLREAIAENAHEVWAANRLKEGWTCGPRDDEKKQNPCLIPYSQLPEEEKEYDRKMALDTIKLMMKLGYDLVKREDTELYRELLMRLRNADQTFYCPSCLAKGKKTPIYKRQIFCDVCGHELNIDWSIYD